MREVRPVRVKKRKAKTRRSSCERELLHARELFVAFSFSAAPDDDDDGRSVGCRLDDASDGCAEQCPLDNMSGPSGLHDSHEAAVGSTESGPRPPLGAAGPPPPIARCTGESGPR